MKYAVIYTESSGGHVRSYDRHIEEFKSEDELITWVGRNKGAPGISEVKYIKYTELEVSLKAEIKEKNEEPQIGDILPLLKPKFRSGRNFD